jgi:dihydrolipoamide dehydrogenase
LAADTERYDVIVIGSGPGGYVAAIRAAQLGLAVALIEKEPVLGGTCLHWGCIPTKALLEAAHVLDLARKAGDFGITTESASFDWPAVQARKQAVVNAQAKGLAFLMKKNKIAVHAGTGALAGRGRVTVTGETGPPTEIETTSVILATGSRPRDLAAIPRDGKVVLDSNDILTLDRVPRSLLILGAGAIGMEFASVYSRFGSTCTVVEMLPRALPFEDEEVGKEIQRAFRKRRIAIRTGCVAEAVEISDGEARARVAPAEGEGKIEEIAAEIVLVAVGRAPVTDGLGLESVGIAAEEGFIPVDDRMRTAVDGIYAIGDVVRLADRPHPMLAHVASHEGIVAAETIAGVTTRPLDYDRVPSVTYCEPEVASVGLSESEATRQGYSVKTAKYPFAPVARARISGETDGFVKVVADDRYGEILGVHIIGPKATELIAEACVALNLETTGEELVRTIHAHPTLAESVGEAAHGIVGQFIHI